MLRREWRLRFCVVLRIACFPFVLACPADALHPFAPARVPRAGGRRSCDGPRYERKEMCGALRYASRRRCRDDGRAANHRRRDAGGRHCDSGTRRECRHNSGTRHGGTGGGGRGASRRCHDGGTGGSRAANHRRRGAGGRRHDSGTTDRRGGTGGYRAGRGYSGGRGGLVATRGDGESEETGDADLHQQAASLGERRGGDVHDVPCSIARKRFPFGPFPVWKWKQPSVAPSTANYRHATRAHAPRIGVARWMPEDGEGYSHHEEHDSSMNCSDAHPVVLSHAHSPDGGTTDTACGCRSSHPFLGHGVFFVPKCTYPGSSP